MHQRFGILLLLIGFQGTLTAQHSKETVVAPFGFDSVEGPASIGAGAPPKFRFQWQCNSQWFPQEPIEITELAFRRNESTLDQEVTFPGLEVALSTQAADLGTRFRDNIGEDEQVVFAGDLVQALPVDAAPRPFDVVVPVASPFSFDPSHGDLLVDFRAASNFGSATVAAVPEPSPNLILTTLAIIFMGCRGAAIDILEIGNVRRRSQ